MAQFQVGDRIEFYPGEAISFKADVLKVAKNGRLFVRRWFALMHVGTPKEITEWRDAGNAVLVRHRAA